MWPTESSPNMQQYNSCAWNVINHPFCYVLSFGSRHSRSDSIREWVRVSHKLLLYEHSTSCTGIPLHPVVVIIRLFIYNGSEGKTKRRKCGISITDLYDQWCQTALFWWESGPVIAGVLSWKCSGLIQSRYLRPQRRKEKLWRPIRSNATNTPVGPKTL